MNKVVTSGIKVDFHIHSVASKHKDKDGIVDDSTIENLNLLIKNLNDRQINMCSITDHDNFDYNIYKKLKKEEEKGSIRKVLPAVEFSVKYNDEVIHIITIFDDNDDEKLEKIQDLIFNKDVNMPIYDDEENQTFSEQKYLGIIKEIGLNVVMIAHQKETLSSKEPRKHDVMTLGKEAFNDLVFIDYFESFEFKNKRNEIFNKYYIERNKESLKSENLRFITGSDCHNWNEYPEENEDFLFTYLKCLPTFRGVAMAITNTKRIKLINSFFSNSTKTLKNIEVVINSKNYDIELSNGINVIVGDNSIGKSLLIHKLTDYEYLKEKGIQKNYTDYLKENNIDIKTNIHSSKICKFDKQGAIRNMFEKKSFKADDFFKDYFPINPSIGKYKMIVKNEVDRYISVIKNKNTLKKCKKELTDIEIKLFQEQAKSLNIQSITLSYKESIEGIAKAITLFENINENINKLLNDKYILNEDKKILENDKNKYIEIISKYNKKIEKLNLETKKINTINTILTALSNTLIQTKTDATKAINNFETAINNFKQKIVSLYFQNRKQIVFEPNVKEVKLPANQNEIGLYRFVSACKNDSISNDYIIDVIRRTIGKKFKDINSLDEDNIPDKFIIDKTVQDSFESIMDNIEKEIKNIIDEDFVFKPIINNLSDTNITRQLSSGFNSKIYFDILANQTQKDGIYIIDQPEDDVSQTSIKSSLLDNFYKMSQNRQLILITHNPQFIVNLDVDNVIFLTKDAEEIVIQSGALEYYDDNYDILKIIADNIDGGVDSINERWKRYEKNI